MAGLQTTNGQADAAPGGRFSLAPQPSAQLEGGQDFARLRQAALAYIDPTRQSRHAVLKTSKVHPNADQQSKVRRAKGSDLAVQIRGKCQDSFICLACTLPFTRAQQKPRLNSAWICQLHEHGSAHRVHVEGWCGEDFLQYVLGTLSVRTQRVKQPQSRATTALCWRLWRSAYQVRQNGCVSQHVYRPRQRLHVWSCALLT